MAVFIYLIQTPSQILTFLVVLTSECVKFILPYIPADNFVLENFVSCLQLSSGLACAEQFLKLFMLGSKVVLGFEEIFIPKC